MNIPVSTTIRIATLLVAFFCQITMADGKLDSKEKLGEQLYFDVNLSLNRSQSCASCHSPENGFSDPRKELGAAVSLGDNGQSFGDRNAPTASYANQIPNFHQNNKGHYIGGQFWDGREPDLRGQAGGPPLNPIEMGMPSKQEISARLQENTNYVEAFKTLYHAHIFLDAEAVYAAMTESIAAFETTSFFSPFDSKYDRYLRGEYQLSAQEDLGMTLFFSEQFTNCTLCHQLKQRPLAEHETFSDYSYHNIGIPKNTAVRQHNQTDESYVDNGLLSNPAVIDLRHKGKFKVPTLRNVAVTGPYMHNGVFQDLKTVIAFYNKYNSKDKRRQINPETLTEWQAPEIDANLSLKELRTGPALDDKRINALVAFLNLLTDKKFEPLITTGSD